MGSVTGNLVADSLTGKNGNLVNNALVGVKIQRQAGVVFLDNRPGGLFDRFRADSLCINS